jgi:hypothetical protein
MRIIVKGEVEIQNRSKRTPTQTARIIESSEEEIRFIGARQGK